MEDLNEVAPSLVVVTASSGIARLPGKYLLPLGDLTVLEQVVNRCTAAHAGEVVVVSNDPLEGPAVAAFCRDHQIACYYSAEKELSAIAIEAARDYAAEALCLVSAADPLVEPKMLRASVNYLQESGMDYTTVARLPVGTGAEALRVQALISSLELVAGRRLRGSLAESILAHDDVYDCAYLPPPPRLSYPELSLRLRNESDYWLLQQIYQEVRMAHDGVVPLDAVIGYLCDNPDLTLETGESYAVVRAN